MLPTMYYWFSTLVAISHLFDSNTFFVSYILLYLHLVLGLSCFHFYLSVAWHSRLDRILVIIVLYLKSLGSLKDSNSQAAQNRHFNIPS